MIDLRITAIVVILLLGMSQGIRISIAAEFSQGCDSIGPAVQIAWTPSPTQPGLSTIRNGYFRYDLDDAVQQRLIQERVNKIQKKAKKRLGITDEALAKEHEFLMEAARKEVFKNTRRSLCFDAVRVDPTYYEIELVDVLEEIDSLPNTSGGVRKVIQADGEYGLIPAEYDVETLMASEGFRKDLIAFASGGWSAGVSRPEPIGYLRIDENTLSSRFYPDLTALFCIEDRHGSNKQGLSYMVAQRSGDLALTNWSEEKFRELGKCTDVLQVGPRIIEFDNSDFVAAYGEDVECILDLAEDYPQLHKKIGICESSLGLPKRKRVVFAADFGIGIAEGIAANSYIYLFYFKNEVSLFGVQKMFLETDVFSHKELLWALNLAGDNQSFFAMVDETGGLEMRSPNSRASSGVAIRYKSQP